MSAVLKLDFFGAKADFLTVGINGTRFKLLERGFWRKKTEPLICFKSFLKRPLNAISFIKALIFSGKSSKFAF